MFKVVDSFFDNFDQFNNTSLSVFNSGGFTGSSYNWNVHNKEYHYGPVLTYYSQSIALKKTVVENVSRHIENIRSKITIDNCNLGFYYWLPGSGITWHNDAHAIAAVTVYLNDDWDINFGGSLIIENESKLTAHYPVKNKGIIITNKLSHTVTPSIPISKIRRTVQVFFTE